VTIAYSSERRDNNDFLYLTQLKKKTKRKKKLKSTKLKLQITQFFYILRKNNIVTTYHANKSHDLIDLDIPTENCMRITGRSINKTRCRNDAQRRA